MTISIPNLPRGLKNWWTSGIKPILEDMAEEINGLVLSGLNASAIFGLLDGSTGTNLTLGALTTTTRIDATTGGLALTLPPRTDPSIYDGGVYWIINGGATNAFAIKENGGGTLVAALAPGATAALTYLGNGGVNDFKVHVFAGTILCTPGLQELWIPAGAMRPSVTGGCAPLTAIASAASQPDIVTLDFDPTTQEYCQFAIAMPKSWDRGTVKAQFAWSHVAAADNRVVWDLQAVAQGDDDAIAAAYGTAQLIADGASTGGTANDLYLSGYTPSITIAGSPAQGDVVHFRASRVTGNAADVMAVDARLHGIRLAITTNAANDA